MAIKTQVIFKNEHIKIIQIDFKKGDVLKEHKTGLKSQLSVIKGEIIYQEAEKKVALKKGESIEIPIDILHSVEGIKKSIALLIQELN